MRWTSLQCWCSGWRAMGRPRSGWRTEQANSSALCALASSSVELFLPFDITPADGDVFTVHAASGPGDIASLGAGEVVVRVSAYAHASEWWGQRGSVRVAAS